MELVLNNIDDKGHAFHLVSFLPLQRELLLFSEHSAAIIWLLTNKLANVDPDISTATISTSSQQTRLPRAILEYTIHLIRSRPRQAGR
jgi:hypothetical protein